MNKLLSNNEHKRILNLSAKIIKISLRKDFSGRLATLAPASVHVSDEGCCCVNGGCSAILTASRACGYLCARAVRPFITSSICWCHYSPEPSEKNGAHTKQNKIKLDQQQQQKALFTSEKSHKIAWRAASRPPRCNIKWAQIFWRSGWNYFWRAVVVFQVRRTPGAQCAQLFSSPALKLMVAEMGHLGLAVNQVEACGCRNVWTAS